MSVLTTAQFVLIASSMASFFALIADWAEAASRMAVIPRDGLPVSSPGLRDLSYNRYRRAAGAVQRELSVSDQPLPIGIRFSAFVASARLGSVTFRTPLSNVAETLSGSTVSPSWKDLWKLP